MQVLTEGRCRSRRRYGGWLAAGDRCRDPVRYPAEAVLLSHKEDITWSPVWFGDCVKAEKCQWTTGRQDSLLGEETLAQVEEAGSGDAVDPGMRGIQGYCGSRDAVGTADVMGSGKVS